MLSENSKTEEHQTVPRKIPNNKVFRTHVKVESKKDFEERLMKRTDSKGRSFDWTWRMYHVLVPGVSNEFNIRQGTEEAELKRLVHESRSPKGLQKISFDLNGGLRQSTIRARLERMTESLKRWNRTPNVSITIQKNQIYDLFFDTHLLLVINALEKMRTVKRLDLHLNWCQTITEEGLSYIRKYFRRNPFFESLNLKFENCSTGGGLNGNPNGFQCLAGGLQNLPHLKHLDVNLTSWRDVTDNGMETFSSSLKSLGSLQSFNLNFGRCFNLTDATLCHLREGMKGLTSLKNFSLYSEKNKFTAEGMKALREILEKFTLLKNADIQFKWQDNMNDEGLQEVAMGLKGLGSLQNLVFAFAQ